MIFILENDIYFHTCYDEIKLTKWRSCKTASFKFICCQKLCLQLLSKSPVSSHLQEIFSYSDSYAEDTNTNYKWEHVKCLISHTVYRENGMIAPNLHLICLQPCCQGFKCLIIFVNLLVAVFVSLYNTDNFTEGCLTLLISHLFPFPFTFLLLNFFLL